MRSFVHKWLVYGLLAHFGVMSLLPGGDMSQLARLPEVVRHYRAHYPGSTLDWERAAEFIWSHFVEEHAQADGHSHDGLPFSSVSFAIGAFLSQEPSAFVFASLLATAAERRSPLGWRAPERLADRSCWRPPNVRG